MYVVFVRTGRENVVFRELKKYGFEAILPVKQEFRNTGKKWKIEEKIIFANYVFLKCEMTEKKYGEIRKIRYIQRILGWDDNCVPFLKKQEQSYIEWLWNGGKSIEPLEILVKADGEKVVVSGILKKYPAEKFEYNAERREVLADVEIAGFSHKIAFPAVEKKETFSTEKNKNETKNL